MKRESIISRFECSHCGNIIPLPRKISQRRRGGHIKHIWCIKCKEHAGHIEQEPKKYK